MAQHLIQAGEVTVNSQETHYVESEMGVSSKPKAKAFFLTHILHQEKLM
ncbi:hypothetical protein [Calothrix sp. 336/3]|nr:hypothetical protein [Calothrix sp. 336/3]